MDLTDLIYDFNLATTETAKDTLEICTIINSGRKKSINYDECLSLYDIVERFNECYMQYLEYKKELSRIFCNLGEEVLYENHSLSDKFSQLSLQIYHPAQDIFASEYAIVKFICNRGHYYASVNNGKMLLDTGYKIKALNIKDSDIEMCLDIVRNFDLFLESYRELKNKFIFSNGTTMVSSQISGNLFDKLTEFTLSFGSFHMNTSDFLEVKFRLGKKFKVLNYKSKMALNDEEIKDKELKEALICELLKSVYVKKDMLCNLYKTNSHQKILGKKEYYEK